MIPVLIVSFAEFIRSLVYFALGMQLSCSGRSLDTTITNALPAFEREMCEEASILGATSVVLQDALIVSGQRRGPNMATLSRGRQFGGLPAIHLGYDINYESCTAQCLSARARLNCCSRVGCPKEEGKQHEEATHWNDLDHCRVRFSYRAAAAAVRWRQIAQ